MRHFSEAEFVDLIEGRLPAIRAEHADECDECRALADALGAARSRASADEGPEPSPLFWDHFAARVGQAVREEPVPASEPSSWRAWLRDPASAWAAAASVAMLMLVAVAWRATLHAPAPPTSSVSTPDTREAARNSASVVIDDVEADTAWAVVRTAVEGVTWEDVHRAGIAPRPGSAERVALELNADERAELRRLLDEEIKRTGA